MTTLVQIAGAAQLLLAAGSLAIPRVLDWHAETARLRPLTRQVFWTYAGYIWATNIAFGLLSVVGAPWLLDGGPLAAVVTGFITLYWGARLVIQFAYFDRSGLPGHAAGRLAEAVLVLLFVFLTAVYGRALVANLAGGLS